MEQLRDLIKNINRLEWSEYYASMALLASARSPCERLRVGCILVKDKRVISMSYNGYLPGAVHESIVVNDHEQATSHAESNCVSNAARNGINTMGSDAYITHYPCINCYKLLVSAGIKKIYFIDDYKNDINVCRLISLCGVPVIQFKSKNENKTK